MTREEILSRLTDLLGEEQAVAVADALTAEAEPPTAEAEPPTAEAEQPPTEAETPPAEAEQPPTEAEQPPAEAEQPPAEAEQPPAEAEQPPAEAEQPAVEVEQPTALDAAALQAENGQLRMQLGRSIVKLSALSLGVSADRVDVVCKLAELNGLDPTSEGAAEAADAAVRQVLEQVPELASGYGLPVTGSAGAHPRQPSRPADPFMKGFFR